MPGVAIGLWGPAALLLLSASAAGIGGAWHAHRRRIRDEIAGVAAELAERIAAAERIGQDALACVSVLQTLQSVDPELLKVERRGVCYLLSLVQAMGSAAARAAPSGEPRSLPPLRQLVTTRREIRTYERRLQPIEQALHDHRTLLRHSAEVLARATAS